MEIDVVADIHGAHHVLRAWAQTTDADVILQLGDFGVMPNAGYTIAPGRAYETPTMFIPGNHDDHDWLRTPHLETLLPTNLSYLGRVGCFTLGPWTVAYLGGGYSIDRDQRVEGVDWWRDEEPTLREVEQFATYRPDLVITHEAPLTIIEAIFNYNIYTGNSTSQMLDNLLRHVPDFQPKVWLFGHHHPHSIESVRHNGITFIALPEFTGYKAQVYRVTDTLFHNWPKE